jgi:hypothetical protein
VQPSHQAGFLVQSSDWFGPFLGRFGPLLGRAIEQLCSVVVWYESAAKTGPLYPDVRWLALSNTQIGLLDSESSHLVGQDHQESQ